MNNKIQIPGLLTPDRQESVEFFAFKKLPYSTRMLLYAFFIIIGFSIQLIMMDAWPGAIFLICATILNLIRSHDRRVAMENFYQDENWTEVDIERIQEIEKIDDQMTKWNRDGMDISNISGVGLFIVMAAGMVITSLILISISNHTGVGVVFITDAIILVLPIWFNGMRLVSNRDILRQKADIIIKLEEYFQSIKIKGENFRPAMILARDKSGKSVPMDIRFTISFNKMPDGFYGIQTQINMNVVEGRQYPYFYCVIPAKKDYGLKKFMRMIPERDAITVEFQEDSNAEVIVIRQHTTKKTGYHTKIDVCKRIMEASIKGARTILMD